MKLPINIVILTPGFAADEQDTTAIPSLQLYTKAISSHYPDLNIKVIAFHYPFNRGTYRWNGVQVYSFSGRGRKWNKPILWINILLLLFRIRRSAGIDIVHAFWLTDTTFLGLLFCRLTGTPFLATAMGQDATRNNKYLRILRFFSFHLTMISDFQSSFLKPFGKSFMFKVIPFGIDPAFYQMQNSDRPRDIIGVGNLNSVKNYDQFIGIIEIIVRAFPLIRCKIIGEGPERTHLEGAVSEKKLDKNILLTGALLYNEVIKEMESARILLHTSKFEGQALVILEALAAGQYVVSTPVGIASTLSSEKLKTGTSTEGLAHHLLNILDNRHADFSPEVHMTIADTCREYNEIYQTLLSGRKK